VSGASVTESVVEEAAPEWLECPGYAIWNGTNWLMPDVYADGEYQALLIDPITGLYFSVPGGATQVLPVLTYEIAFGAQRLGEAIAVALYMLPALAAVIIVLARYMRRGRRS